MAENKDVPMNTFPEVTDTAYIYAESSDGSQVKIKKSDLFKTIPYPYTGSGILNGVLVKGKWYRIAIGDIGSKPSSAIINIGKVYNNTVPSGKLLYLFADGYSGTPQVSQLAVGGANYDISKVRILYISSYQEVIIDIYVKSDGANEYNICYSNNIGFKFQNPKEVSAEVPEGYSVKEFSF